MDNYLCSPTKDEVKKLFIKEKVLLQLIMFYKLYRAFEQVSKSTADWNLSKGIVEPYLIFVIFFTLAKFLENKIYTEKRQFFALNL